MVIQAYQKLYRAMFDFGSELLRPDTINGAADVWDRHLASAPQGPLLSDAAQPRRPETCILGVIDDAISFWHPRLTAMTEGGPVSRVAAAWLMGATRAAQIGQVAPIGREIRGVDIDPLLQSGAAGRDEEALFRDCGLWNAARGPLHAGGRANGHGAAVADLLAGMAPTHPDALQRPVIAVGLPPEIMRDTEGTFAPWFIYAAMTFILRRAAWLIAQVDLDGPPPPVVINMSYGVTAGAKDGQDMVARFLRQLIEPDGSSGDPDLDALRRTLGEIRVVLPMGNHRLARLRGRLRPGESVHWSIPPGDGSPNFLEVWGAPQAKMGSLDLRVTPPGQAEIAIPQDDAKGWIKQLDMDPPPFRVYKSEQPATDSETGQMREVITLAIPPTEPKQDGMIDGTGQPGLWRIRSAGSGDVDVYVQRDDVVPGFGDDRVQSRLWSRDYRIYNECGRPVELDDTLSAVIRRGGTVNVFATGLSDRMVRTAGRMAQPEGRIAWYSGLSDEHTAPPDGAAFGDGSAVADVSLGSPGINVRGNLAGAMTRASGTSLAAPQVARALANALAEGREVTIEDLNPPAPAHPLADAPGRIA